MGSWRSGFPGSSRRGANKKPSTALWSRLFPIAIAVLGITSAVVAQVFQNYALSENILRHAPVIFTASGGKWAGLALVVFGMLIAILTDTMLRGWWRLFAIAPLIIAFVCLYPLNQKFSDDDNARLSHSRYERCSVKDTIYRDRRGHLQTRYAWVTIGSC